MSSSIPPLLIACVIYVCSPQLMLAQAVVASQGSQQAATLKENSRLISGNYKNVELRAVLEDIASKANYKIWYTPAEPALRRRVTVAFQDTPASAAFARILNGTGVTTNMSEDGKTILVVKDSRARGSNAQGVITGKVTDAKTGRGISGASVTIGNDARGVITAEDGSFRIANIPTGTHLVSVRLVGFGKQSRAITVGEGAMVTVDFKLEQSANVLDQVIVTGTVAASELKSVPNAMTIITAKQIEERGIVRIDQLFRGDVPGLFALNLGSLNPLDSVMMYSRGSANFQNASDPNTLPTSAIKTYVDGVELARPEYLSQIDPKSIERIEILAGPQASTVYGSNALNGVMQVFTKRAASGLAKPQISLNLASGFIQNNFSSALAPMHSHNAQVSGNEGRLSYTTGGSWDFMGQWTPGKQTQRMSGYGSGRFGTSKLTIDGSLRYGLTRTLLRGTNSQGDTDARDNGVFSVFGGRGVESPTTFELNGNTAGLTFGYTPMQWWSHELVLGSDASKTEMRFTAPSYLSRADTLLSFSQSNSFKNSQRYTTTARMPVTSYASGVLTVGVDHWRTRGSRLTATPASLSGTLASPGVTRSRPEKNTGGFLQGQLGLSDMVFLTYGLRAEWNPNFGDDAQPNLAPRYGIAVTRDVAGITAKLRGSYGRSTRPPLNSQKTGVLGNLTPSAAAQYPLFYAVLPNEDLGPEHQQGGEGGVELYFGSRGSIGVTRYNQTVDRLILNVSKADSLRSLVPNPVSFCGAIPDFDADGYGYLCNSQYINVGGIRNQGWEAQGALTLGPISTKGTYSWTKSRVLGITEEYRTRVQDPVYEAGARFNGLPEHTWALNIAYNRLATNVSLNLNGTGLLYEPFDDLFFATGLAYRRFDALRPRRGNPINYLGEQPAYVMADLSASQRLSRMAEATLQIQNLTDYYRNDLTYVGASIGRQTRLGVRLRWN